VRRALTWGLWVVAIAMIVWFVAGGVAAALAPEEAIRGLPNPVGLSGAAADAVDLLGTVTALLALPALGIAAAALVVRLRRSRGVERLQLKWFAYAAAVAGFGLGVTTVTNEFVADAAFVLGLLGLIAAVVHDTVQPAHVSVWLR